MKKLITVLLICISFSLNAQPSIVEAAIFCDEEKIDHACCYVNSEQRSLWVRNSDPGQSNRIKNSFDVVVICSQIRSIANIGGCTLDDTPEYKKPPTSRIPRDCVVVEFK